MGLVQVLVDILSIKKTKEWDHIVLLAVKCLWVIISKPINTNNITSNMEDEEDNNDDEEEEEERKEGRKRKRRRRRKKKKKKKQKKVMTEEEEALSKLPNDLKLPLEWFLDSLPLLLASAASYEDYSTATRLKTSEFLQIILTLSTKLDASAIENLSLKWLKSKAEKMQLQACTMVSSLANSSVSRKRLGRRGVIKSLFNVAEKIGRPELLKEAFKDKYSVLYIKGYDGTKDRYYIRFNKVVFDKDDKEDNDDILIKAHMKEEKKDDLENKK